MTVLHPGVRAGTLDCVFDMPLRGVPEVLAGRNVLGRVAYTHSGGGPTLDQGVPLSRVPMVAPGAVPFTEVWVTDRPVRAGLRDDLVYAEDGEYLFCAARIGVRGVCRDAVQAVYGAGLRLAGELGYPELFRMWDLVGDIAGVNDEGRAIYQDFCEGRAQAFEQWGGGLDSMPAATGTGALGRGADFYFLACRPGHATHLENPRQIPAYGRSQRYRPRPPSFARGTHLAPVGYGTGAVYVSGTASVLGDDTVHVDDIERQCDVTLANIEALVSRENLRQHAVDAGYRLADLTSVKVYVRDAEHLPVVRARCAAVFGDSTDIAFLNVGIRRPDVLVEIEGICR